MYIWSQRKLYVLLKPNNYKNVVYYTNHTTPNSPKIKSFNEIPGPVSFPVIGTLHQYLPLIGSYKFDRLHQTGLKKIQEYGPIVREQIVPGVNIVYLFKPDDIELMYRYEGKYPQRRSHLALRKYRLEKPNIFNTAGLFPTNGAEWLRLRSVFQKGLSKPTAVHDLIPATNDVIQEWLDRIKELSQQPDIDYLPELSRMFLEVLCVAIFDLRMDSFSKWELRENSRSSLLLKSAFTINSCILKTDNGLQLWKILDTPMYRRLKNAHQYMENVALDLVTLKMSIFKEKHEARSSILESYLSADEIDLKDIVGMACDLLLAGVDTTTYSMSFILYYLANNKNVQDDLYNECKQLMLPSPFSPITKEILNQAQYARAVLKETLRLRPVSIGVGRVFEQDAVFSGYQVPKGTVIVTQNQVACLQEQHFRKAHEFIPERWLRNHALYAQPHPFLVLPFGHGPRSCIARRLAEQNMLVALMKIVFTFEVGWSGGHIDTKSLLINIPDGPINLTFKLRQDMQQNK